MLTNLHSANVIGVAVTSRETSTTPAPVGTQQTCPQSFTCPENNGCSYSDGSRTLTLSCGMDFYGGDFANQYASSFQACTQACAVSTECVAASFVGGKGAGTCYLKSMKNNGNVNSNVDGMFEARNDSERCCANINQESTLLLHPLLHLCPPHRSRLLLYQAHHPR